MADTTTPGERTGDGAAQGSGPARPLVGDPALVTKPDATTRPVADFPTLRVRMVNNQLRTFDVTDHRIQDAMAAVERERFVPPHARPIAYSDDPIEVQFDAIGLATRVLTAPALLGRLLQFALPQATDRVLLVGAATGYTAAVLARLAAEVVALEVDKELVAQAKTALFSIQASNVELVHGPLPLGWPQRAPYDVIFVDGAVLTEPVALEAQLKDGGRMVLVEGEGLSGRARISLKSPHGVSSRYAINAAAGVLPGFRPEPTFVF